MSDDRTELDTDDQIAENGDGYPADLDDYDDEGGLDGDDSQDESLEDGDEDRTSELGEADSLESDESAGAFPAGQMPSPPPGYESWEQAYEAQARRAQQLEHQQSQAYEQYRLAQEADSRRQHQQHEGFMWQLPHEMNPDMQLALRLRGTEGYSKLSPAMQQRADEVAQYMSGHWDRWTYNPQSFVQDVVLPQIAPAFQQMTQQLAELKAAEFRRMHQQDLADPEDVQRYLNLVDLASSDPYQASLEFLRMQRALEQYQRAEQGHKTKARDRTAQSKSAKGKPAQQGRTKGRRGKRKSQLNKKERANPHAVANDVLRQMLANGELSRADLGE